MVDTPVLGTGAARLGGSSPLSPTNGRRKSEWICVVLPFVGERGLEDL